MRYVILRAVLSASFAGPIMARVPDPDPDAKAARMEAQMTDDERLSVVWGYMPVPSRKGPAPTPPNIKPTAGYFPPIERLGLPPIFETDAGLGITNPKGLRPDGFATALPSGLALASTFDVALARQSGAMIGSEARSKGFNILLAGGVNLTRDWYGGRNFEYLGEDPLLAGVLAGESIAGVQSQRVVSTVKHFALNSQETLRHSIDAKISEAALRESDLLAFQIAIERGQPGALMCAYNKINAVHSCSNDWLLNGVLRREWGFKGWVMSDWGAVHGPEDMLHGLDQESGAQLDTQVWFDKPLRATLGRTIARQALSTSVKRILRSLNAVGADEAIVETPIDFPAHAAIARKIAAEGMVLLKNDGILPLAASAKRILVVGRYADRGVWSGSGSSQVTPVGGVVIRAPYGGSPYLQVAGFQVVMPSSPWEELKAQLPGAQIDFDTGYAPEVAAVRARSADLVLVFANQWQSESIDHPSLVLPEGQDRLIDILAAANPNMVVVLETGNPVAMPWLGKARAVLEAWYSGQMGGAAIADVLTGRVNPSGRLPITFPMDPGQAPRASPPGLGLLDDGTQQLAVSYTEGADVGYRWYASRSQTPLFAFGHGLSYTRFAYGALKLHAGKDYSATFTVSNVGERSGADVPQLYLVSRDGKPARRLVAFDKVFLAAGETRTLTTKIDPRLLADWSNAAWTLPGGQYGFALGTSAMALGPVQSVRVATRRFKGTNVSESRR
ncbi:glycoside hydrolase family 3 C-terminal domain-containing protein [Sphingomonas sp. BIUV-7]|uniref:Glycoside hydrolase family 3 C-terminal domain-containing protein n=1 Tax=Sphingomonas natans TaxID=3063330 RepID=A0ABT8Y6T3_9SPHN|nr:glycoside hydrolase family 3 C-terminal domain-containing protein [Sphingomonas sp. BIUV-7]MDO6414038.1 glycoside hydrolase family 3 C-terminal domain-containing protein [Sphingomonas sp. BIUV-7]